MAIAAHVEGSQTCVIGSEHTLNTTTPETTDGVFCLVLDFNAAIKADIFEIRFKEKARAADTQRLAFLGTVSNDQGEDLWISPAVILLHGWDMTLKQTAGTGRAVPWSIRKIT